MPFCPQCGVDNPAGARYCDQCGAMLIPVPAQAAPPPVAPSAAIPAIGPTVCPQCGQAVIPGEAFCDNCGAPLRAPARPVAPVPSPPQSAAPPQPVYPPPAPVTAPSSYQASVAPPAAPPPATPSAPPVPSVAPPSAMPSAPPSYQAPLAPPAPAVPPMTPAPVSGRTTLASCALVVIGTGAVLPLPADSQALVGRSDPVSKFYPDVDLGPHGALDQGVGRRHARIFVQGGQVMIEDLDSVNGTLVNGQRVLPHQSRALSNGDQITLGRMLLRFQA
ncbi:FHA domain-containing protein [Roseiflexus castenholzii]|uniref:FHA domain containing protein n=1 Tax=Roseiflexus castenholzii (strain DSM 13941 / HLO8) TaxID=383372 RepID=A7NNG5_ROSCS|nr:FHA domain-containing protein [Roseiflexus castenholzii]ABU59101.1 FHA domain containing protein [Roseiflexus castenholzii DSM 13941]